MLCIAVLIALQRCVSGAQHSMQLAAGNHPFGGAHSTNRHEQVQNVCSCQTAMMRACRHQIVVVLRRRQLSGHYRQFCVTCLVLHLQVGATIHPHLQFILTCNDVSERHFILKIRCKHSARAFESLCDWMPIVNVESVARCAVQMVRCL